MRELVEATKTWLKNDEFVAGLEKQAALQRELASIGDPRQRYITGELSKLEGDASADQIQRATAAAEAMYDAQQRIAAGEKAASEAARERQQLEREFARDAERVWNATRTEVEKYAAELERLNELLRKGAIDQETYGRAAAKAANDLAEARKAARIDQLSKSDNPADGLELASMQYFESMGSGAEQMADLMLGAFGSMEDAFAEFVRTGKMDFDSLVEDMLAGLARVAAQQMVMSLVGGLMGGAGGASAAPAAGGGIGSLLGGGGGLLGGIVGVIGSLFGFAEGGKVAGPGTGTSDDILARLSNGEFVVNADATRRFGPLLEAINAGKLNGMGRDELGVVRSVLGGGAQPGAATSGMALPAFADGGPVGRDQGPFFASLARDGSRAPVAAGAPPLQVVVNTLPGQTADVSRTENGGVQVDIRRMVRGEVHSAFADGYFDDIADNRWGLRRQM